MRGVRAALRHPRLLVDDTRPFVPAGEPPHALPPADRLGMLVAALCADGRRVSQGFFSLWSKARNVFNKYLSPVDEACSGLFPPMVQKILVINVPRIFTPFWSVITMVLPEQHKVPPPRCACALVPAFASARDRLPARRSVLCSSRRARRRAPS